MQTELILIRHGETAWNALGRIQGHTDIALNDKGLNQAQRVAQAAAQLHSERPISAVISSDLQRAQQTAQPIAEHCELPLQTDARLREKGYGILEGLTWEERKALHSDIDYAHELENPDYAVPQGESRQDFFNRVTHALREHAQAHEGKCIVIVAHGGVLDMAYRFVNNMSLSTRREWDIPNAALNALSIKEGAWSIRYWGEVYHLSDDIYPHTALNT